MLNRKEFPIGKNAEETQLIQECKEVCENRYNALAIGGFITIVIVSVVMYGFGKKSK